MAGGGGGCPGRRVPGGAAGHLRRLDKAAAVDQLDADGRDPGATGKNDGATGNPVTPRVRMVELRGTELEGYGDEAPEPWSIPSSHRHHDDAGDRPALPDRGHDLPARQTGDREIREDQVVGVQFNARQPLDSAGAAVASHPMTCSIFGPAPIRTRPE